MSLLPADVAVVLCLVALVLWKVVDAAVSPEEKSRRRLLNTRRTPAADLTGGLARITGTARSGGETLRAPVSERACLAYRLSIQVDAGRSDWREVATLRGACTFTVTDETGEALIEPQGNYVLVLESDRRGGPARSAEQPQSPEMATVFRLLRQRDIALENMMGHHSTFRYVEAIVQEGDRVAVYGAVQVQVHPQGERGGPRGLPVARVFRGTFEEPVRIGDGALAAG
jgi:hypothetical protein